MAPIPLGGGIAMKKVLIVIAIAVLAFSLVGCSKPAANAVQVKEDKNGSANKANWKTPEEIQSEKKQSAEDKYLQFINENEKIKKVIESAGGDYGQKRVNLSMNLVVTADAEVGEREELIQYRVEFPSTEGAMGMDVSLQKLKGSDDITFDFIYLGQLYENGQVIGKHVDLESL